MPPPLHTSLQPIEKIQDNLSNVKGRPQPLLLLANSSKWMKQGVTRKEFGAITLSDSPAYNTTLGVIATNANLSKKEVHQVAQIAHSGLAKMISPLHTTFDGDLLFAISYGKKKAHVNTIGLLAEAALMDSVKRAIIKADGFGVIPAYKDLAF